MKAKIQRCKHANNKEVIGGTIVVDCHYPATVSEGKFDIAVCVDKQQCRTCKCFEEVEKVVTLKVKVRTLAEMAAELVNDNIRFEFNDGEIMIVSTPLADFASNMHKYIGKEIIITEYVNVFGEKKCEFDDYTFEPYMYDVIK